MADENYRKLSHWRPLKSGCISQVVLGLPGMPIRADAPVPGEVLGAEYHLGPGRAKLKTSKEADSQWALSLQGIYRLAPHSAEVPPGISSRQEQTA